METSIGEAPSVTFGFKSKSPKRIESLKTKYSKITILNHNLIGTYEKLHFY